MVWFNENSSFEGHQTSRCYLKIRNWNVIWTLAFLIEIQIRLSLKWTSSQYIHMYYIPNLVFIYLEHLVSGKMFQKEVFKMKISTLRPICLLKLKFWNPITQTIVSVLLFKYLSTFGKDILGRVKPVLQKLAMAIFGIFDLLQRVMPTFCYFLWWLDLTGARKTAITNQFWPFIVFHFLDLSPEMIMKFLKSN